MMKNLFLGTVVISCFAVVLPAGAATATAPAAKPAKAKRAAPPPLNLQGFRPGMGMTAVRQMLQKKGVTGYATAFADLFVYRPSRDAEVRLTFTCGPSGPVLGEALLETVISRAEASAALPRYREMLLAKYGPPARDSGTPERLDLCWGACAEGAEGARAVASTADIAGGDMGLRMTVSNAGLVRTCGGYRARKIDQWLTRWARDIVKFQLGMGIRAAADIYKKRYGDSLLPSAGKDNSSGRAPLDVLAVNEHEFFAGLDGNTLMFEGQGPGTVRLLFTGNEAAAKTALNQRLFAAMFSTTAFADRDLSGGLDEKLRVFIRAFGKPADVVRQADQLTALWQGGGKRRRVTIEGSGMITVEQEDSALLETYRDAAVRRQQAEAASRFERNPF